MRGDTKKLELPSGRRASCSTGFLSLGECSRNPSVSVYQLALLWEDAFSLSEYFEDYLNVFAHFVTDDLWVHLPTRSWVCSSFQPKTPWPPCPTLPGHLVLPQVTFLFSSMKEVLKGKKILSTWDVEDVGKKPCRSKGIKIDEFNNCFEKKMSWWMYFEDDWILNM